MLNFVRRPYSKLAVPMGALPEFRPQKPRAYHTSGLVAVTALMLSQIDGECHEQINPAREAD
jgi:hypothetical protein